MDTFVVIIITLLLIAIPTYFMVRWAKGVHEFVPQINGDVTLTAEEEKLIRRVYARAWLSVPYMIAMLVSALFIVVPMAILDIFVQDESGMSYVSIRAGVTIWIIISCIFVWYGIGAKMTISGKRWKTILAKAREKTKVDMVQPEFTDPRYQAGRLMHDAGKMIGGNLGNTVTDIGAADMVDIGSMMLWAIADHAKDVGAVFGLSMPKVKRRALLPFVLPIAIMAAFVIYADMNADTVKAANRAKETDAIENMILSMENAGLVVSYEHEIATYGYTTIYGHVPQEILTTTDEAYVRVNIIQGGEIGTVEYRIEDKTLGDVEESIQEYQHLLALLCNGLASADGEEIKTRAYQIPDDLIKVMKETRLKATHSCILVKETKKNGEIDQMADMTFYHCDTRESGSESVPERGVLQLSIK